MLDYPGLFLAVGLSQEDGSTFLDKPPGSEEDIMQLQPGEICVVLEVSV